MQRKGGVMDIPSFQQQLAQFATERDWDQFHSPKNLAMALAGEVGELLELFQWLTERESRDICRDPRRRDAVSAEVADIQIYLLGLADKLGIDLESAVTTKIADNSARYPVALSKGNAIKYSERGEQR